MNTKQKLILSGTGIILIVLILIFSIPRSVTIILNGDEQTIQTRAWTVEKTLTNAGLSLQTSDQITPPPQSSLLGVSQIIIDQARPVQFREFPSGKETLISSASREPLTLLETAGIMLNEKDQVLINGEQVDLKQSLPYALEDVFEIKHAVTLTINTNETQIVTQTSADTLEEALLEAGISLHPADRVNPTLTTKLTGDETVEIKTAKPVTVQFVDSSIEGYSAAETIGEALIDLGVSLQNLDYSIPEETAPLPAGENIRVVRVREESTITQTSIPYSSEYVQSDQVELDKTEIVQEGVFGVEVTRTLVRYEDGVEVSRTDDTTWTAKEPQNQITGRGTKPVVKTMETPDGTIEYWRAVTVHATSYSPCRSGVDTCYYGTSSGLPVQRGVIGVTRTWYNLMVGQQVYVPGYGKAVIGDVGGGIPGEYWIDLGFTDADFEPWSSWVTMYFLTPVPDYIPWILP